ncbi:MAG TPA: DNA polymerase III subunit delta, partial [Myxococcaceae bacterium]|nr:DNA polymerase III subunit delta [Myxococcaceae bacterium]
FLAPKKARGDGLAKARDAWKSGRRKEGARRLLALAARAGWGVEALESPSPDAWRDELNVELAEADRAFLSEVAAFCREEKITAPEGDATPLAEVLRGKLPAGHVLVLAASEVDARNPLVKLAEELGCIVERKIASRYRDLDVSDVVEDVLRPLHKRLEPGAGALLKDRCGANMRLLQSELEKVALYAEGPTIRAEDVDLLVAHAREEEFLELSDALQKRDLRAALRYASDAMEQGSHPLQLLGAIASIVRGLVLNADRLRRHVDGGQFRMSFNDFKASVFPGIEKEARAAKEKPPHPYGAYAGMQAAQRYGQRALLDGLVACADADLALKTSGNGPLIVERLLWGLCAPAGGRAHA